MSKSSSRITPSDVTRTPTFRARPRCLGSDRSADVPGSVPVGVLREVYSIRFSLFGGIGLVDGAGRRVGEVLCRPKTCALSLLIAGPTALAGARAINVKSTARATAVPRQSW